jgi:uncharacterized membrane protein YeaQ/YmgE (transglycosylase-associated protein family)
MANFVLMFFVITFLTNCTSTKPLQISASKLDCQSSDNALKYDSLFFNSIGVNADTTGVYELLKDKFSQRSLRAARSFNFYHLLGKLVSANNNDERLKYSIQINQITDIHSLGMMDFSAVIHCEKMRLLEVSSHLEDWKGKRINRITVASIIVGGVAGIAASTINLNEGENTTEQATAIAGAVIGTYLGFKTLKVNKKIYFAHPRNMIREIWENTSVADNIPTNIHVFLTKPFLMNGKITTGKEQMKASWESKGLTSNPKTMALLLSEGGNYDNDALSTRIQFMDSFAEEMRIMQYDLKRLMQELVVFENKTR